MSHNAAFRFTLGQSIQYLLFYFALVLFYDKVKFLKWQRCNMVSSVDR